MAGSFQLVISPLKIFATVSTERLSSSMPSMWKATATGPTTRGRCQASLPPQRFAASAIWLSFSGESEPPKSTWPAMNCFWPAPEPVAL